MYPNIQCNTIYNSQDIKQPKWSAPEDGVKMWYINTIDYYSVIKRNDIGSFVETWMDPESII